MSNNEPPQNPTSDPQGTSGTSGLPSYGSVEPPTGDTPPPPGGYPPPAPGGYGQPPAKNSTKAIVGLVLGIVSLLCCGLFTGIPAIIVSVIAKKEINSSNGQQTGGALATAGLVLGIVGTAWSIVYGILIATGVVDSSFNFSTSP